MTTEQPTAPRILRRRSDDRVIGGVAAGIGDFLNVDPLLIRIGFVGLMVFGGLGLLLYVGAWLLVPDDTTDESILQQLIRGSGVLTNPVLRGILLVTGVLILASWISTIVFGYATYDGSMSGTIGVLLVALVVVLLGALLFRGTLTIDSGGADSAPGAAAAPARAPSAPAFVQPRPRARRRPPSPLGWYVIGAVLVGIGALALLTNVADVRVGLAQYLGLTLAVIGIGLVVGTWWGHARLLILLGLLILPFAITASFISVPLQGGFGDQRFTPMHPAEVQSEYHLGGGQLTLDLTEVELSEPMEIAASVAMGELVVYLPEDANGQIDAAVGAGTYYILGASQGGTQLENRFVLDGSAEPITLDLDAGLGTIRVYRDGSQGR